MRAIAVALLAVACVPGPQRGPAPAHPALVEDVSSARQLLEQERTAVRLASGDPPGRRIRRLVELGLLADADSLLATVSARTLDVAVAEAELRYRQYRFSEARSLAEAVLAQQGGNRAAKLVMIRLAIQAWQLDWAAEQAASMLGRGRRDAAAALLMGRVHLLRRDYDGALEWARRVREWDSGLAAAQVLEAEALFWMERSSDAEAAYRQALEIDPLNADARFGFGYALWRRGAPGLLVAMADQWNLAVEIDPLHQQAHWYLGNGHTPLTYADYAAVADTAAREALAPVDSLLADGRLAEAVASTRRVEAEHPRSVLPALWRGSAYYLLGDRLTGVGLDSALAEFRTILGVAPNFGPAHNGVAAVLKQKQLLTLARHDSLEAAIAFTPLATGPWFDEVFPDLAGYPGDRVARMVVQQLGPAMAFLPLLHRQGQRVRIPPLHRDLAAATGDPSFRTSATFDNRRWMDIRGVGGSRVAAAGIEYVERGSHQERGVLLHEFTHLVHASLLTDSQRRQVRALYLAAVQEERTLDYYAATNPQEFFAQAVEAYQSPAKVHPLNYKSMNTREDLRRVDPDTYAFVESLVADLERSRAGDGMALRSNWAQVYVNLAGEARHGGVRGGLERAAALLDSALVRDGAYLPAMLEYAVVEAERGRLERAAEWLRVAESIDPAYAPIQAARGAVLAYEGTALPGAGDTRITLLRRAADMERDPQIQAELHRDLWELYEALGRLPEAIATAEAYAESGSIATSPLRAIREEAATVAMSMRAELGYPEDALGVLRERVARALFDPDLLGRYADALVLAGDSTQAAEMLQRTWALLDLAGDADPGVHVRLAELRLAQGDTAAARALVEPLLRAPTAGRKIDGRLVRLLVSLGEITEAHRRLAALPPAREPAERAEVAFTRGWISAWRGDVELAENLYREALAADGYHRRARVALHRLLLAQGRVGEAREVVDAAGRLATPLGPAFHAELERQ